MSFKGLIFNFKQTIYDNQFPGSPLSYFMNSRCRLLKMVDGLNFKDFVEFLSAFSSKATVLQKIGIIFKVYDSDCNGKLTYSDLIEVLRDLTGSFMSKKQRELLHEAGYAKESSLLLDDFIKVHLSKLRFRATYKLYCSFLKF
ncbi:calcineurin subunit b type 2 [Phtheirospermum japonicum]|uniref:Calcineurin subunit b type 2 n=1 Tax=Phtheirospermum japonicum TaxID=374723 RepID=A0A830CCU6_9LAMI|nr:calcineurin subunit b type 2 [Phtheirospermum japonicum]